MNKLKIALDFDDVIVDTVGEFVKIEGNHKFEEYTGWDFSKIIGRDEHEIFEKIDFKNLKLIDKRIPRYIKKLNDRYWIDVVTARRSTQYLDIYHTLDRLGIKRHEHYHNLHCLGTHDKKNFHDYDIYIDDNPNLINYLNLHKCGVLYITFYKAQDWFFLFDRPWNWKLECQNYVTLTRVKKWKTLYNILRNKS